MQHRQSTSQQEQCGKHRRVACSRPKETAILRKQAKHKPGIDLRSSAAWCHGEYWQSDDPWKNCSLRTIPLKTGRCGKRATKALRRSLRRQGGQPRCRRRGSWTSRQLVSNTSRIKGELQKLQLTWSWKTHASRTRKIQRYCEVLSRSIHGAGRQNRVDEIIFPFPGTWTVNPARNRHTSRTTGDTTHSMLRPILFDTQYYSGQNDYLSFVFFRCWLPIRYWLTVTSFFPGHSFAIG